MTLKEGRKAMDPWEITYILLLLLALAALLYTWETRSRDAERIREEFKEQISMIEERCGVTTWNTTMDLNASANTYNWLPRGTG